MAPIRSLASLVLALVTVGCGSSSTSVKARENARWDGTRLTLSDLHGDTKNAPAFTGHWAGEWTRKSSRDVMIVSDRQLAGGGTVSQSFFADRAAFDGLPSADQSGPIEFSETKPAGTLRFVGTMRDRRASGDVTFTPNASFFATLAEITGSPASTEPEQTLSTLTADISLEEGRRFKASGLRPSLGDLIALKFAGVTADYACPILEAGYTFDADTLRSLHFSGVSGDEAIAFKRAGYAFSADDLRSLHFSGVEADFAAKLYAAGYRFGVDDLRNLHFSGIDAPFAVSLAEAGYKFPVDELRRLHFSGVDAEYAVAAAAPNRPMLSAEEIANLRQRGIDLETLRKLRG